MLIHLQYFLRCIHAVIINNIDSEKTLVNLEGKWKNLVDFVVDLKKNNVNIPQKIITVLTFCKSLINHCKYHVNNSSDSLEFQKILTQLSKDMLDIESSLIIIAANRLGEQYALEWSVKLGEKDLEKLVQRTEVDVLG
ncbi:MAG: DUF2096 family protein [Nitrososphaerota archaeon]